MLANNMEAILCKQSCCSRGLRSSSEAELEKMFLVSVEQALSEIHRRVVILKNTYGKVISSQMISFLVFSHGSFIHTYSQDLSRQI